MESSLSIRRFTRQRIRYGQHRDSRLFRWNPQRSDAQRKPTERNTTKDDFGVEAHPHDRNASAQDLVAASVWHSNVHSERTAMSRHTSGKCARNTHSVLDNVSGLSPKLRLGTQIKAT